MTTYRCFACGTGVEVEVTKELDLVEIKPCEVCLHAVEEESYEEGLVEGRQQGYDEAIQEVRTTSIKSKIESM